MTELRIRQNSNKKGLLWFKTAVIFVLYQIFSRRQTAVADMPSPSPVKPSFSSVVAFTDICEISQPQAFAIRSRMEVI